MTSVGTSSSSVGDNPIVGFIAIGAMVVSVWALVCGARMVMAATSLLLEHLAVGDSDLFLTNILLSGIAGVFAGAATMVLRCWSRKPGHVTQSFLSALFNKGLAAPELDGVFWSRVFVGAAIGFLVGSMSGAIGIISFPQFLSDSAGTYFQGDVFPLLTFLGGGFGGPGGDGFWSLLFLILVIILTAILTSLLAGVLLHTVVWALSGGAKAGAKALTMRALSDPSRQESGVERHPIVAGIARGALVGVLTGIVQSTFTVLGVMQFYGRHS